ncbi:MAG: M67 family metallopeptidase [Alphaproteobacteria bacterium]|nr:M67 family metallopeptidase [Alphaproteobacteria bacterium]
MRRLAEAAHPKECCGLLIGRRLEAATQVDEIRPCRNLLDKECQDRFEIDPTDRFAAMRQARAMGREIVGHYHAHPQGPARPSETDRGMMYEPELIWLIIGMQKGQVEGIAAFRPNTEAGDFDAVLLVIEAPDDQNSPS